MTDPLIQEFLNLAKEQQAERVSIAKQHADSCACFLCKWIVRKIRFEDFPRDGRMKHLMLCCAPDPVTA